MERFVKKQEQVLICLPDRGAGTLLRQSAEALGAGVWMPHGDYRWMEMVKTAFIHHVTVVIGPAVILLGLAKAARATQTPLYIRHAVIVGEVCPAWMLRGIEGELDCRIQDFRDLHIPGERPLRHLDGAEELVEGVYSWNSVLDCRIHRGEYGLELELVVVPGLKLPKLPACGKMTIRSWDPDRDQPMDPMGKEPGAKFFCIND